MTEEQQKLIEVNVARAATVMSEIGPELQGSVVDAKGNEWSFTLKMEEKEEEDEQSQPE